MINFLFFQNFQNPNFNISIFKKKIFINFINSMINYLAIMKQDYKND